MLMEDLKVVGKVFKFYKGCHTFGISRDPHTRFPCFSVVLNTQRAGSQIPPDHIIVDGKYIKMVAKYTDGTPVPLCSVVVPPMVKIPPKEPL